VNGHVQAQRFDFRHGGGGNQQGQGQQHQDSDDPADPVCILHGYNRVPFREIQACRTAGHIALYYTIFGRILTSTGKRNAKKTGKGKQGENVE